MWTLVRLRSPIIIIREPYLIFPPVRCTCGPVSCPIFLGARRWWWRFRLSWRSVAASLSSWSGKPTQRDDSSPTGTTGKAEWTYRRTATGGGEPFGPSDWFQGFPDCGGTAQSPINLAASTHAVVESTLFDLQFSPHTCASGDLSFIANERVWEVLFGDCAQQASLSFNSETYNLVQIHIHSPSEHAIGGSLRAAEIHWVHLKAGTADELLVVGVLFDVSEYGTNVEIQPLWDVLDIGAASTTASFETRIYDLIPPNKVFSHYTGSLTTPPCTEGVTWIVMNEPTIISKMQLDEFRKSVALFPDSKVDEEGNTNRPYQPLNGRDLFLVKA